MNHNTVRGRYTYAFALIVVLDRRFLKAVGLCGHVVDRVLAFFGIFLCSVITHYVRYF